MPLVCENQSPLSVKLKDRVRVFRQRRSCLRIQKSSGHTQMRDKHKSFIKHKEEVLAAPPYGFDTRAAQSSGKLSGRSVRRERRPQQSRAPDCAPSYEFVQGTRDEFYFWKLRHERHAISTR